MNAIQEMLVLVNVAKAHGDKTITVGVDGLELLLTNYVLLDRRVTKLEKDTQELVELTDRNNYAKGM